jgi:putative two-component system response regulator
MKVLIVDDDEFVLAVLENTLTHLGFSVTVAHDGNEAMDVLRLAEIRLVVTDWDMPAMNGIELCKNIRRADLPGYVYVIMLTGREGAKQRLEGLCSGADDFLNKPLDPDELMVCLKTAERILSLETRDVALFALAKLAESRDVETGAHVERVQTYSRIIMRSLSPEMKKRYGVVEDYIRMVYQTSALHDLGKVGVPDRILLKPGKLTEDEFSVMKTHTIIGAQTLDAALQRFPNAQFLQIARDIAATHHERFDGSGYPNGLVGEQIPLCGRVVAIADVYDALTSRRIYKEALTHEQAMVIVREKHGNHFDPEVLEAFLRAEDQIIAAQQRLRDDTRFLIPKPFELAVQLPKPSSSSECKILLAEDDPLLRAKLRELLLATGEPVYMAEDGSQAIELLELHAPRILVSDWIMPKMDGIELCQHVRGRNKADSVHFIMLTVNCDKEHLLEAFKSGVDDFIAKPFEPEEVLARVRAGIRATKLCDERVREAKVSNSINAELAVVNSRLEYLTITDELTGLFNRRHAMSRLEEQWANDDRYGRQFSVAMLDIDHFKTVNDTYGHNAGDLVLQRIAAILRESTRETDAICRMGGEEFLIIFPAQNIQEAVVGAERCRTAVAANPLNIGSKKISLTISIGVATRILGMTQITDLLKAADNALYAAKRAGRNKVLVFESVKKAIVEKAINDTKQLDPVVKSEPSSQSELTVSSQPAPVNMDAVLNRCGGDPKFAAAITERFRRQALGEVAKVESAMAANDAAGVQRVAHSLKSMASYMAAETATEIARHIEELGRANQLNEAAADVAKLRMEIERIIAWLSQNGKQAAA